MQKFLKFKTLQTENWCSHRACRPGHILYFSSIGTDGRLLLDWQAAIENGGRPNYAHNRMSI